MKIGIIGLPQSGKTTVFNAITGQNIEIGFGTVGSENIASVKVPDERLEWLRDLYQPKKFSPASIDYADITGAVMGDGQKKDSNEALKKIKESEALIQVVRFFENENVLHIKDSLDAARDIDIINSELLFADLDVAQKRVDKLKRSVTAKGPDQQKQKSELAVLLKIIDVLENEDRIANMDLDENELKAIRGYQFYTQKPMITMANVDESQLSDSDLMEKIKKDYKNVFILCADMEMEISQLDDTDKASFLKEMGLAEPASTRLIKESYRMLGLHSFFTSGEDEVKAWTIDIGDNSVRAASKIHSDIARGFIRAEVMDFNDLKEAGSEKILKEKKLARLEGKEYIVKDGDIINFKFNV